MYTANRDISQYTVLESHLVNMPLHYRTPEEIAENVLAVKMMMIDDPEILSGAFKKSRRSTLRNIQSFAVPLISLKY